jgi:rRNA maturation endonuclease Nob1
MSITEPVEQDAPIRVCRKCSTQAQTGGAFCPHCGARYSKEKPSRRRRALMFGIPAVVLVAAAVTAVVLIIHHNHQVAARKRAAHVAHVAAVAAAAHRQAVQQAAAKRRLEAKRAAAALKRDEAKIQRLTLVSALQGAVKKDAQKDVSDGTLSGTIIKVQCDPATAADSTAPIANYTCIAATSESGGELSGYRFSANINVQTGSYTWHLGD